MNAIITFVCTLSLIACTPSHPGFRLYWGTLPPNMDLDLTGTFTFSPKGELSLVLAAPCRVTRPPAAWANVGEIVRSHYCDLHELSTVHVIATTPWSSHVRGDWIDARRVVFRVDWKNSGLDPLADDSATLVTKPWAISGLIWTPNPSEARRILDLVSKATDTETDVVIGGPVPSLEVTRFEVGDGFLHAGGESTLILGIANRGPGTAYRVVAITRAGVASLHGLRLGFGQIKPGTEKTRLLRLTVPASESSPDTMLVLVFREGNGFPPHSVSRRVPIATAQSTPLLAVSCSIPGRSTSRPDLDAGEDVVLHCMVDNSGARAANAELEVSIAGAAPVRLPAKTVAPAGHTSFDVPITIPRQLTIDAAVEIAISVRDRQFARAASTKVIGVIRKPKLRVTGQLTRAQYDAKLVELRAERRAGDLTQAEFDRYDAELVTCLP